MSQKNYLFRMLIKNIITFKSKGNMVFLVFPHLCHKRISSINHIRDMVLRLQTLKNRPNKELIKAVKLIDVVSILLIDTLMLSG